MANASQPLYSGLDPSKKQIRLLRLLPQSSDTDKSVRCSLHIASLDDSDTAFDALSYCWGTLENRQTVYVDDKPVNVTQNLAALFRHFQRTTIPLEAPIWIDAICINQDDVYERNSQVAIMGDIYQRATKIHIWLGIMHDAGPETLNALEETLTVRYGPRAEPWMTSDVQADAEKVQTLRPIALNPYWKRIWIIQEVSFADRVDIRFNDEGVSLYEGPFMSPLVSIYGQGGMLRKYRSDSDNQRDAQTSVLSAHIRETGQILHDSLEPVAMANWMSKAAVMIAQGQSAWLRIPQVLFLRLRHSLATDPRDKIYGTLNLFPGILSSRLTPDYTKTMREVGQDATLALIETSSDLEVLCQACSNCDDLPSWVPDFRVPSRMPTHLAKDLIGYEAGKGVTMTCRLDEERNLVVKGHVLDAVHHVSRGISHEGLQTHSGRDECVHIIQQWRKLFEEHYKPWIPESDSQEVREFVFWRAACCGVRMSSRRSRKEDSHICNSAFRRVVLHGDDSSLVENAEREAWDHLCKTIRSADFFMTAHGHAGLVPAHSVQPGDCVLILGGSPMPFCARRLTSPSQDEVYRLGGPCFIECDMALDPEHFDGTPRARRGIMQGSLGRTAAHDQHGQQTSLEAFFTEITIV